MNVISVAPAFRAARRCLSAQAQPGPPARRVLMRRRVTKVDQDTVAHVLGDKAREATGRFGDTAVIGADNLAQILGIETYRRRPDRRT